MSLEAAIMGFLAEEPRTGYDLKTRCFDDLSASFWNADQAQIYRTLDRLHSARLIACRRQRQVGKPDRKVYRLTAAGEHALATWLASCVPPAVPRDPFLLQLRFSASLTDEAILEKLLSRRAEHQARLEYLRGELLGRVDRAPRPGRQQRLTEASFDAAIARERAVIDWLDDTIEALRGGALPRRETALADADDLSETGPA
jgi:DNA-binding PadR family transcriptional regulator